MKKLLFILGSAAAMMSAAANLSAQDMAQATETYNNGAMALQMGDNAGALEYFKQALTLASACGEEGTDIVNNSKDIIPKIHLSIAKDLIKDDKLQDGLNALNEAVKAGKEYNNPDVVKESEELIPQVYLQEGTQCLSSKNISGAVSSFQKVIELDPENGTAFLRLGMAYGAEGKLAEAESAYLSAAKFGQESTAMKSLSTLYLKISAAKLKAKNYQEAIDNALKANEYQENATSMKIAGTAASQLKKNAEAIQYLEKYIALAPTAKDVNQMCYTIAALSQMEGDKEKACGFYKKIVSDPKFGETAKQQMTSLGCN